VKRVTTTLLFAAATGCATDLELRATEQHADEIQFREYAQCSTIACRLLRAQDSDNDGIADIDEEALGTDAKSPFERPSARDLYAAIGAGLVPTWNEGRMTIVVLPTQAPDGTQIFGGEATKPAREELFEMLKLGDVLGSFDLSHGVVINEALGGPELTSPGLGMQEDKSWAMDSGMPGIARELAKTSRNQQVVDDITYGMRSDGGTGMQFGSVQRVHRDGATDDIHWQSLDGELYGTIVSKDKNGTVIGTGWIKESTKTSSDGTKTTTTESSSSGKSGTSHERTEKVENGDTSWTHTDWENTDAKTGESNKGSSTSDGDDTHWINVHYNSDGSTHVTSSDGGKEADAIQDASLPGEGAYAYMDPDYIEADPDMAAAEEYVDKSPIHIFQDPAGPDGAPAPPSGNGVYILTTGDDVEGPCCGRVNLSGPTLLRDDYVMQHVQPDYDPNLAEPPPEKLPDVGTCLDCSK
jgi:hypothetical protein